MKRAKRKAESQNNSLTVLLLSLENPSARKAGHGHNGGSVKSPDGVDGAPDMLHVPFRFTHGCTDNKARFMGYI